MKNKLKNKTVIIFAIIYLFIGIGTAIISNPLTNSAMQVVWRLTALIVSIIIFIFHIRFEIIKCLNSPKMAAINTSCAVALGTFALSVLANINVMVDSSSNNNSMLLALLIWPIITGSLSFLVAFIISKIIISIRSKS